MRYRPGFGMTLCLFMLLTAPLMGIKDGWWWELVTNPYYIFLCIAWVAVIGVGVQLSRRAK